MGRLFSWSQLVKPAVNGVKCNKLPTKRSGKQLKECLLLDQLLWLRNNKKTLSQPLEKIDQNWYCQVMKGAKYSRIGDSFIDPNLGIKCVRIDRPDMSRYDSLPPQPLLRTKPVPKRQPVTKVQPRIETSLPRCNGTSKAVSPSSSVDGRHSAGSSETGSVLSAAEIVRQSQRFLPKLEASPLLFSNSISLSSSSSMMPLSADNIDVLNYDFSFTSPPINS